MDGLRRDVCRTGVAALVLDLVLSGVVAGQEIMLATGAYAGLASNQNDCSFEGHVRSIRIYTSDIDTNGRESALKLSARCIFDAKGRTSESWQYADEGEHGQRIERFVSIYDAQGHEIETDIFDMKDDPKRPDRSLTTFDPKGRAVETRSFDSDGELDGRTVFEFDNRGDAIKETLDDPSGQAKSITTRQYDANHHVLSEESSDKSNGRAWKTAYRYSDQGKVIEEIVQSPEGSARYLSTYDQKGRLSSTETITEKEFTPGLGNEYGLCGDCGVFPGKTMFRYNEKGLIIEEQAIQPPDHLVRLSRYKYDQHGHHTEEWVYQANSSDPQSQKIEVRVDGRDVSFGWTNDLPVTVYRYDARGNWIRAEVTRTPFGVASSDPRTRSVTYRFIDYR